MAKYNTLRNGSSGDDVKKLQTDLINAGYDVGSSGADGIYGSNTEAAVRKYQKDKGLSVDGIAGDETLGSLYGGSSAASTPAQTTPAPAPSFDYAWYKPSDTVVQAQQMLEQQLGQKPGQYQSQWQSQLDETINKILNREKFSYDMNADALYQQYKDKYIQQGKMAMMDTMGQAQAMTGGYGNSYAQSVGQQAYQAQLQNLNDIVPELYQLALDRYNQEGQDLLNQYSMLGDRENQDYSRYQDAFNQWLAERDYLSGRYDAERDYDYNQFVNDLNTRYQMYRDQTSDSQWQAEFDEAKRQYDQQYELSKNKSTGSESSSSSRTPASDPDPTKEQDDKDDEKPVNEYKQLLQDLDTIVAGGASRREVSGMIRSAFSAGTINQNQAQKLLSIYAPRGNAN